MSVKSFGQKTNHDIESKIDILLNKMSLEEKAGQMWNTSIRSILKKDYYWQKLDTAILDTALLDLFIGKNGCGSIHNYPSYPCTKDEWYRIIKQIQDYVATKTPNKIPILYGMDDVHGANYVLGSVLFPHQIAIAATFNTEHAYNMGKIGSYEARAASLPWNYSPVLDYAPNPFWGRIFESFGEDPYLITQMGNAFIEGSQGDDLKDTTKTAVCLKHFIGYGGAVNGTDRANAIIPESYMREYYLPPFIEAINKGAQTIMISSNSLNGVPCHASKYLLTKLLKEELNFQGFIISDFNDIYNLVISHYIAKDEKEAIKIAVNAGLDMAMAPYGEKFPELLVELVNDGEIPMERINDAVRRILRVKMKLGLFEHPYSAPTGYTKFASGEHIDAAYNAAKESITLLKNQDDILPLKKNRKYLVTGVAANSLTCLNGAWSRTWSGTETEYDDSTKLTILDAIKEKLGKEKVTYVKGTDYEENVNIEKAVTEAQKVDQIIVCLGERPATEKPSDIVELAMPEIQQRLVKKLSKTGKPVILVLVEARPRIIKDLVPLVDGIILGYLPGDEGGRAITDVLFGDVNPSGKLPYTYPKLEGKLHPYIHKHSDIRIENVGRGGYAPEFPFGYGMSYSNFVYDSIISINKDTILVDDELIVKIKITNTSSRTGKEVVQLYLSDKVASIAPDVKRLKRFKKIELSNGETKEVSFKLTSDDFKFIGEDNKPICESGDFIIGIGGNSKKLVTKEFYFKK